MKEEIIFTLRDFATQSGYSIFDPVDLLDFKGDVTVIDTATAATYRYGDYDGVLLGGEPWGAFWELLDLPIVWVTYDRHNHHVYIEVQQ